MRDGIGTFCELVELVSFKQNLDCSISKKTIATTLNLSYSFDSWHVNLSSAAAAT